eukprot:CAMPEP_0206404998 /NCGR_PEP_ID=MMETSP0294-20121207/28786_1 /ASSEMBLY_ACC=CAM_ASM_000327 /TAXON_ID=39354 /ORGANISM="Heterosigma akashiwo, Strain CCMP2393" /LENGTH=209 /DNA_ID=CAMNT_0053863171 /DNA_START=14 /DNA_END=640 /DNA_ORIENTATION=-
MTGSDSDRSGNGEDTDNEPSSSDAGSDDEHERKWESTSSDEEGSDDDEFERHNWWALVEEPIFEHGFRPSFSNNDDIITSKMIVCLSLLYSMFGWEMMEEEISMQSCWFGKPARDYDNDLEQITLLYLAWRGLPRVQDVVSYTLAEMSSYDTNSNGFCSLHSAQKEGVASAAAAAAYYQKILKTYKKNAEDLLRLAEMEKMDAPSCLGW